MLQELSERIATLLQEKKSLVTAIPIYPDRILLRGYARSFYEWQLVQTAVKKLLPDGITFAPPEITVPVKMKTTSEEIRKNLVAIRKRTTATIL